jgi:hypothetical protein
VRRSDTFRGGGHSEVTRLEPEHIRFDGDRLLGTADRKGGRMRGLVYDSREHVTDKKNQSQHHQDRRPDSGNLRVRTVDATAER